MTLRGRRGRGLMLVKRGRNCEEIRVKSPHVRGGYPIGSVCKVAGGWEYAFVGGSAGRYMMGPVKTKSLALRKAVKGYTTYIGAITF